MEHRGERWEVLAVAGLETAQYVQRVSDLEERWAGLSVAFVGSHQGWMPEAADFVAAGAWMEHRG